MANMAWFASASQAVERATISELRNGLSAYLRRVRRGESVLVMDRKVPVARLIPVDATPGTREERPEYVIESRRMEDEAKLARLEASGTITQPARTGSSRDLIRSWKPIPGAGLVEAVIAARRENDGDDYR